ncbi:MAG: glutamine-hydrolyzing carbamoyl-phosphate synthase small subunit [Bdellovibrionota bacterium]
MKGFLVLETKEVYEGISILGGSAVGEVVFNTSHSGYEEIATDPSYMNQIVVMTAPMQGNYGAHKEVWESRRVWIEGFICVQVQQSTRESTWIKRLQENKVPLIAEIDTRKLVMRLREGGTPWGAMVEAATPEQALEKGLKLISEKLHSEKDWVHLASRKETEKRVGEQMIGPRLAVLDFGSKENILRLLQKYSSEVTVFPARTPASVIKDYNPDGIVLTNGPGDPADAKVSIENVTQLLGYKPIYGICMGHQILALAMGAKTYKLRFGHRGSNHPIKDDLLGKIYMSSQNHGYAVNPETLPKDVKVTQTNLNDKTCAGFYSKGQKALGIQYHPESSPGPHDAENLFKYFIDEMILRGSND